MSFTIEVADISDIPAIVAVQFAAFNASAFAPIFPPTAAGHAWQAISFYKEISAPDCNASFVVARDDDTGFPVAVAKWVHEGRNGRPLTNWRETSVLPLPQGADKRIFEDFFDQMANSHELVIQGREHMFLHMLATLPDYRKRGLGSRLLKWGADIADEQGLECYLDGGPMGRPLYEKNGYLVQDIAKEYTHSESMRRMPTKRSL